MLNIRDDPIVARPAPKPSREKKKSTKKTDDLETSPLKNDLPDRTRSKRDSKRPSKAHKDTDEDIVMGNDGFSNGVDAVDAVDDEDEDDVAAKHRGLQRSNTNTKKAESKLGGLFGAFKKSRRPSETMERSKPIIEDDVTPRKRTAAAADDSTKRPRHERRKSVKAERAAEGFVYNADPPVDTEADDANARKEERRAKRAEEKQSAKLAREAEMQAIEDRRSKRRKAERDADNKKQEDREARRAARRTKEETSEGKRAKNADAAANKDLEDEVLLQKPRGSRHEQSDAHPSRTSKHRSDRRKSYLDPTSAQESPAAAAGEQPSTSRRPKSSRRKSTTPAVDSYFDSRNAGTSKKSTNDPYLAAGGGNDHTSSWIQSQLSDPPAPPPVEGTILEAEPELGAGTRKGEVTDDFLAEEEDRKKNRRKSAKRRSKAYVDPLGDEQERREVRPGVRNGAGGGGGGGGDGLNGVKLGNGEKTWEAKTGMGKRSSWLQKMF